VTLSIVSKVSALIKLDVTIQLSLTFVRELPVLSTQNATVAFVLMKHANNTSLTVIMLGLDGIAMGILVQAA
jgi:hypothetical protein